jgi:hypothetical protein
VGTQWVMSVWSPWRMDRWVPVSKICVCPTAALHLLE